MWIAAIVGKNNFPTLDKAVAATDFEDALAKALQLLYELDLWDDPEDNDDDPIAAELTENYSYTAEGWTIAIGEIENSK